MSNVPNTSLHSFANGETVTQDMLNQDIQVLQSAVNDNDTRISTLQSANQGALSKVPSGISFPSNPQQGWIFFRTDVGTTGTFYIYDSTNNWNADPSLIKAWIQNNLGLGVTQTTNVISGSVDVNTYKTSGFYFVSGTVTNQPVAGVSGYLQVQVGNANGLASQTYICDGSGAVYQRIYTGGVWSAWKLMRVDTSTPWTNLTLQNNWVYYGSASYPQYRINASGDVQLKGIIKSGTVANNTVITTLPVGFRPTNDHHYVLGLDGANVLQRLEISNTDGTLFISNGGTAFNNGFLILDLITFPTV